MEAFNFITNEGLYYGGNNYIADFNPEVTKRCLRYDMETGSMDTIFWVAVTLLDGTKLDEVEVKSLHKISYFDLWNCPDSYLTGEKQRLLEMKLQQEASKLEKNESLLCGQGLHLYKKKPIYVFGNEAIDADVNVQVKNGRKMEIAFSDCHDSFGLAEQDKYLSFFPGVSEILFYGSLLAVVKPFLWQEGYNVDFVIAIVGPSGHLKTTMVRKYALWLRDRERQEISFRSNKRIDSIIASIDELSGQNFLMDDFHEAKGSYNSIRQGERLDTIVRHIGEIERCANVMITSESMNKMGIFSCKDRMLQVMVPQMSSEQLANAKKRINDLAPNYMPWVAKKFLRELLKNYENVKTDIQKFWEEERRSKDEYQSDTRTQNHGLFIKLTEALFRKYCNGNLKDESKCQELREALSSNYEIQQKELELARHYECEHDYVVDIRNMLGSSEYLEPVTNRWQYEPNDKNYLIDKGRIYITKLALNYGMTKYYRKAVSMREISNALHEAGILEEDLDARTKKIDGKRHYVISYEALELYCNLKNE